jgi:hypothetical protein
MRTTHGFEDAPPPSSSIMARTRPSARRPTSGDWQERPPAATDASFVDAASGAGAKAELVVNGGNTLLFATLDEWSRPLFGRAAEFHLTALGKRCQPRFYGWLKGNRLGRNRKDENVGAAPGDLTGRTTGVGAKIPHA